jgi:transcriptional regulator with XRE-family HTH domain
MPTMRIRPELLPTAAALDAAVKASGLSYEEVGQRIGMSGNSIHNYRNGRMGVRPEVAAKLGRLLNVDPAILVSGMGRGHSRKKPVKKTGKKAGKKRGRPLGSTNGAGPAARAAALVPASIPRATPVTLPPAVFRMELRTDGVMLVAVQAALPVKRGAELVRHLLDFGLLPDGGT